MAEPYFELKKSTSGKFHLNLHAANSQIIATSQMYESKAPGTPRGLRRSRGAFELSAS